MTYFLALARSRYEFRTADAINAIGGMAIVPRRIEIAKQPDGTYRQDYHPFLPNFLFCAMSDEMWYRITRKRLFDERGVLPTIRRDRDILARTWGDFQGFADRAELACNLRLEQHEIGRRVARYRKGDKLRIVGADLLGGELRDKLATFLRINSAGQIEAEVQGMEIMGKPVTVRLGPGDAIAAE